MRKPFTITEIERNEALEQYQAEKDMSQMQTPNNLDQDIKDMLIQACELKKEYEELIAILGDTMQEKETISCDLGKLIKVSGYDTIVLTAEGERQKKELKLSLVEQGLGKVAYVKPSMRMTLTKEK